MAKIDKQYHQMLEAVLERGYLYRTDNRPDIDMKQISSANLEIELDEFPAITTKKLYWKGVVAELIWFLRGDDNIKFLVDNDVHIWDKDAYNHFLRLGGKATFETFMGQIGNDYNGVIPNYKFGDVGRNYGVQWRDWRSYDGSIATYPNVDQIADLITNLRKPNPISRRHIVTAWNPSELNDTALPPCHWSFEILPRPIMRFQKIALSGEDRIYLETLWKEKEYEIMDKIFAQEGIPDYGFTLKWHQRSCDLFLGIPFNIASYALLANIIGVLTGMKPLSLIGDLSNVHIYGPHTDAVKKQLSNSVLAYPGGQLTFSERFLQDAKTYRENGMTTSQFINNLEIDDFMLPSYKSFGSIKADMYAPKTEEPKK